MCLRGFKLTAATVLVAELGDVKRFAHPRQLMGFWACPKENTTDEPAALAPSPSPATSRRADPDRGCPSRFHPPKVSEPSPAQSGSLSPIRRFPGRPVPSTQARLHLLKRGLMKQKVVTALARELAGFVWASSPGPSPA